MQFSLLPGPSSFFCKQISNLRENFLFYFLKCGTLHKFACHPGTGAVRISIIPVLVYMLPKRAWENLKIESFFHEDLQLLHALDHVLIIVSIGHVQKKYQCVHVISHNLICPKMQEQARIYHLQQRFSTDVPRHTGVLQKRLKHAPDYLVRGTGFFPLDCQIK